MKRRKEWNVASDTDVTEYNEKLARKLRKINLRVMRIAKHYGVSYVNLMVMGDYVSARAKKGEDVTTATTVVGDYMFTSKED